MKWLLFPVVYAFIYWISGLGVETYFKKGYMPKNEYSILKHFFRRKVLMMVVTILLLWGTPLAWITAAGFFLVHFLGWWENRWMSALRGVIEATVLIPLMFLTTWPWMVAAVLCCVTAYLGANIIRHYDPELPDTDWWHWCSGWIGFWIGLGVTCLS